MQKDFQCRSYGGSIDLSGRLSPVLNHTAGTELSKVQRMKFHPLCELFPVMSQPEIHSLADDIRQHGQREPILIFDGKIIDGRCRFMACEWAKIEPKFKTFDGKNPAALVASLNLHRRHLTESQRAMLGAELAGLKIGEKKSDRPAELSQSDAAKLISISVSSVKRAVLIKKQGTSKLKKQVLNGSVSVGAASVIATLPKAKQRKIISEGPKAVQEKATQMTQRRALDPKRSPDHRDFSSVYSSVATVPKEPAIISESTMLAAFDKFVSDGGDDLLKRHVTDVLGDIRKLIVRMGC
jgi:hypothetical protein